MANGSVPGLEEWVLGEGLSEEAKGELGPGQKKGFEEMMRTAWVEKEKREDEAREKAEREEEEEEERVEEMERELEEEKARAEDMVRRGRMEFRWAECVERVEFVMKAEEMKEGEEVMQSVGEEYMGRKRLMLGVGGDGVEEEWEGWGSDGEGEDIGSEAEIKSEDEDDGGVKVLMEVPRADSLDLDSDDEVEGGVKL